MCEWRWYCISCHRDLGPMVGKHIAVCPDCKCKSAYCTHREPDEAPRQMRLAVTT